MNVEQVIAYLCVADAAAAIAFYESAFGAVETLRLSDASGKIGHAQIELDGKTLMLSDEFPDYGVAAPHTGDGANVTILLQVDDADAAVARATAAGATVDVPLQNQFHGHRSATIRDPFGHRWIISHRIEDVSTEEMQRRYAAMLAG